MSHSSPPSPVSTQSPLLPMRLFPAPSSFFHFYFLLHGEACRILVLQQGTEPGPSAVRESPNRWIASEFLPSTLLSSHRDLSHAPPIPIQVKYCNQDQSPARSVQDPLRSGHCRRLCYLAPFLPSSSHSPRIQSQPLLRATFPPATRPPHLLSTLPHP